MKSYYKVHTKGKHMKSEYIVCCECNREQSANNFYISLSDPLGQRCSNCKSYEEETNLLQKIWKRVKEVIHG